MSNPYLLFCPYLPLPSHDELIEFGDWELGSLRSFEDRWADPRFKSQAEIFFSKFTMPPGNKPIEHPALLCRKGRQLDGLRPAEYELKALELSLTFGFLDANPVRRQDDQQESWGLVTTDNVELHLWQIDLEHGRVSLSTGYLVHVRTGGFTIGDPRPFLPPPLDLHMPISAPSPDPLILNSIYEEVLHSLRFPGKKPEADRIRVAIEWFAKAWRNTATVHFPERLVFLKTAFEAVTGTSDTYKSAKKLRQMFEELENPNVRDSCVLVWSPEETSHRHSWTYGRGRRRCCQITDLEAWFIAFGDVRNAIIHEGRIPNLMYPNLDVDPPITSRHIYHDHLFFTAERLLRGTIKVLLSQLGHKNAWRARLWRCIEENMEDAEID